MNRILHHFRHRSDSDQLDDEAILNVIRREDEKVLKTSEIAQQLPISQSWTGKRLNKLEDKGRVHSKSAGQGSVWWLDESEPSFPVAEGIGDLLWYSSIVRESSRTGLVIGTGLFVFGGILLIPIFLIGLYPSLGSDPFTTQNFATIAIASALTAGLFLFVSGGLRLISIAIQQYFSVE